MTDRVRAFRQGLKDTGYVEGENVAIEYRWAEGQFDRLPELAAELVRRQVDVIVAASTAAALAAKAVTTTIPIVFVVAEDPVGLGLVASLARPGGNADRDQFLRRRSWRQSGWSSCVSWCPRPLVLPCSSIRPDTTTTEAALRDVVPAARAIGLQIQVLNASTSREIDAAFASIVRERPDALFVAVDPFLISRRVQLVNLATRHAIPAIFPNREFAEVGGLMSYGAEHSGCVSSGRRLRRPHPQGREARGPAGRAAE